MGLFSRSPKMRTKLSNKEKETLSAMVLGHWYILGQEAWSMYTVHGPGAVILNSNQRELEYAPFDGDPPLNMKDEDWDEIASLFSFMNPEQEIAFLVVGFFGKNVVVPAKQSTPLGYLTPPAIFRQAVDEMKAGRTGRGRY